MSKINRLYLSINSFFKFPYLALTSLKMPRNRVGSEYNIENAGNFFIFRETGAKQAEKDDPAVLVVRFRLKLIGSSPILHWLFQRACIITTPFWSGLRGFGTKLWMVDRETKDYAGAYEWFGEDNARAYVSFLLPILGLFAIKNSIWYKVYPKKPLDSYLSNE